MKKLIYAIAAAASMWAAAAFCFNTSDVFDRHGAIVRHNPADSAIYLVFSADSMFEGGSVAVDAMKARDVKGSFFFTGNFLRDTVFTNVRKRIVADGHYVGGHSDRHILLCDWDDARTPLVTDDSLLADVRANLAHLSVLGVNPDSAVWFMPPFEWINTPQAHLLTDSLGLKVINPVPGLQIYRDYTTPDMRDYHSSDSILRQLYAFEREKGLCGAIMIMHLGTQDVRTDKLYYHLGEIIDSLTALGYHFERLP